MSDYSKKDLPLRFYRTPGDTSQEHTEDYSNGFDVTTTYSKSEINDAISALVGVPND